jgi:hypothetical protein
MVMLLLLRVMLVYVEMGFFWGVDRDRVLALLAALADFQFLIP